MKAGAGVRQDVIRELQRDPQASDPDAISVTVQDGAVTMGGHAPTHAEKLAAVRPQTRQRLPLLRLACPRWRAIWSSYRDRDREHAHGRCELRVSAAWAGLAGLRMCVPAGWGQCAGSDRY